MKKILIFIICISFILALIGCTKVYRSEKEVVKAKIISKDYDKAEYKTSYRNKKVNGKSTRYKDTKYIPADFDITIEYNNLKLELDVSESEYNSYEIGDIYKINFIKDYDKEDKLIRQYLK
jgi:hypothetical protein